MENNPVIIVPYRNRPQHLGHFLKHYRELLPRAYFIIVEQSINGLFNRGKLLNAGFMQAIHLSEWFIFHDVDMLVQEQPDYSFTAEPTLFATNASQFNWQMPFPEYFGGVVGVSREHFHALNGYPNTFWGWGGEDNALYYAIQQQGLQVLQRAHSYYSLPHERVNSTGLDHAKLQRAKERIPAADGLSTLEYGVLSIELLQQGQHLRIEL